nr:hypothetical protein CKG001_12240 [Bdellovibrio sp. CKG001]BFD62495.1 hypothetical protein BdHM001_11760 [Bdellovibrio sp. HM001]BFD67603.1 hypothetical protein HAGR004_26250 [Bdellovibrio sp. HAGR004]
MKKELLASVLTLSAGMAGIVSFPQPSLARSINVEKDFAESFVVKSSVAARFTDENGQVIHGHIYLSLTQQTLTPEYNNQLRGEMTGYLYFKSDEPVSERDGKKYYRYEPLTGDDGEVLLDRTHKGQTNDYQIYGCNSTMTQCEGSSFAVSFSGKNVSMQLVFAADQRFEVFVQADNYSEWVTRVYSVPMHPVIAE